MYTRLFVFLLALASAASATTPPAPAPATLTVKELAQGFSDHVVLAKPRAQHRTTADAAETRERVRVRRKFARFGDVRVIELDGTETVAAAIARLQATGRYEYVEPNHLLQANGIPNDPSFPVQWGLNNTGQTVGGIAGTPGADIKAPAAWDVINDASGVIVAIIDFGARLTHPDLVPNLWRNPAPTFGDIHGARFTSGTGIATNGDPTDDNGHGTRIAGIIGAAGNNNVMVTGVAWKVQIMPLKMGFGAPGEFNITDTVACLDYAITRGAKIVNCSFSNGVYSQTFYAALKSARDAGVIIVCSAGNNGLSSDLAPVYPANYPLDNIVAVGFTDNTDTIPSGANYGAAIDLVAPGVATSSLSHTSDTGFSTGNGSSPAAAHVSGSLALLKARFPTDTYRQLINRLLRTVDRKPAFFGKAQSGGRLNLFNAVTSTSNRPMNDDFAARAIVSGNVATIRSNNAGASTEAGESAHAGAPAAATLWWEWTAPYTMPATIDTAGSEYDTVLAVYAGTTLGALTLNAANDDATGRTTSRMTFNAQAGTTYQFAVGSKGPATGLTLISLAQPPPNDNFATAITLTGQSTQVKGLNSGATLEPGEARPPGFAENRKSVWYRWTAPRTGRFQIASTSAGFDPLLSVYTGTTVANLTLITYNDNTGANWESTNSLCTLEAVAGATYLIKVDSAGAGVSGDFTLTLTDSLWQAATSGEPYGAAAVAPDGTVYIGADFQDMLYAFAPDGSLKWNRSLPGFPFYSSPTVGNDGAIYHGTGDGSFRAFSPDGSLRWSRVIAPGRRADVTPALAPDGTVYVHTDDGFLYALDPTNGSTKWRLNVNATATRASAAIAPDGTVYQGSNDNHLYAINPDGTLKWRFDTGSRIFSAPAIDAAGNIYVTTQTSARLLSLTAAGALRWTYTGAAVSITASPALSADGATVYFGAGDSKLHAVAAATGIGRWTYSLGGVVSYSSPAVDAAGVVYTGCGDGLLYAINPDGTLRRTWHTAGPITSSPTIAGTVLYVGSLDKKLYAFDLGTSVAAGPWPQYQQNALRLGRAVTGPLAVTLAPQPKSIAIGSSFTLDVSATGQGPLAYQWKKDGTAIAGANSSSYNVASAGATASGSYAVTVTGPQGAMTSAPATVTVAPSDPGRITNVAFRANVGTGAQALIVGFNLAGSPEKPLLVRAIGPTLTRFGVAGAAADPQLQLFAGPTMLATNNDWASPVGGATAAEIASASAASGAFPLEAASRDSAIFRPLSAGRYTAEIGGGAGLVLAELHDAAPAAGARLINASARAQVGVGGNILIAGFVISGNVPKTVLLRAVGPGLAQFGLTGTLANPQLDLYRGATFLMGNDNHLGQSRLSLAGGQVGAFRITAATSLDSQLVATLEPGAYTAHVYGVGNTEGIVLVEIYEVP